jgi:RNA polymerase sigma factor (sigma-70 family)
MNAWWAPSSLLHAAADDSSDATGRELRLVREEPAGHGGQEQAHSSSLLSIEDAATVARLHTGDQATVRALFDQYSRLLAHHARSVVHDVSAAEDVVADVFVSIILHPERVVPKHSLRAYLLWRVLRRARDVIRGERRADVRHSRLATLEDPAVIPESPALPDELLDAVDAHDPVAQRVARALMILRETPRTIVLLRLRDELSYEEIGTVLDMAPAAVRMQLSRSLRTLRALLESENGPNN